MAKKMNVTGPVKGKLREIQQDVAPEAALDRIEQRT
jgi:hypothetical protein